ncbi:MAG TPA: hypothetical protein VIG90_06145 [Pedomonas sp.]|uniref:hypothetical protein n=1 Tax=Pedomonas sp. TaxID=2976421 RepID=UPI002F3F2EF9
MRTDWRFLGVSVVSLLALAGCERTPASIDYKLDGTWAWETQMNCYGNENTIVFDGPRIQVFQYGKAVVEVGNAKIKQESHQGRPLIVVRYSLEAQDFDAGGKPEVKDFREEYLAMDDNTLVPAETEVDGVRQIPAAGSGKTLVRCAIPAEG